MDANVLYYWRTANQSRSKQPKRLNMVYHDKWMLPA